MKGHRTDRTRQIIINTLAQAESTDVGASFARMRGLRPVPRSASPCFRFRLGEVVCCRATGGERTILGFAMGGEGTPTYIIEKDGALHLRRAEGANRRWRASGQINPTTPQRLVDCAGRTARVSEPHEVGNLAVYVLRGPDLCETTGLELLGAALQRAQAVVRETHDVDRLLLDVLGTKPVLVLSGDLVKGGWQDRMLCEDAVMTPGTIHAPMVSKCVEQGRWGQAREGEDADRFGASDRVAPPCVRRALYGTHREEQQCEVWARVEAMQERLERRGQDVRDARSASSLQLTLEADALRAEVVSRREALQALPEAIEDAVGCAISINGALVHAEWFGSHELFVRVWPRLLDGFVADALAAEDESTTCLPDAEGVKRWLDDLMSARWSAGEVAGDAKRRSMTAPSGQLAETLWSNDRPLHAVAVPA